MVKPFNPLIALWLLSLMLCLLSHSTTATLRKNYYADTCPNVESIVKNVVQQRIKETVASIPGAIRLLFHDCFVEGCDASIMIQSTKTNKAEKDYPDNFSLGGVGIDTVVKAKTAVDADPCCRNKVSCADIIAIAARDAVALAGGPWYEVELGRLDGLSSTAASVEGKLPHADFNLDQLTANFGALGLSQTDMIALSGAHTVGVSHCSGFANRIYNFSRGCPTDPALNPSYAAELRNQCPPNANSSVIVDFDPLSPFKFDNSYFKNLQQSKGLLSSDQVLYTDSRSKPIVDAWAKNPEAFNQAFIRAMTNMGRVGVKTGSQGNIRVDCTKLNSNV